MTHVIIFLRCIVLLTENSKIRLSLLQPSFLLDLTQMISWIFYLPKNKKKILVLVSFFIWLLFYQNKKKCFITQLLSQPSKWNKTLAFIGQEFGFVTSSLTTTMFINIVPVYSQLFSFAYFIFSWSTFSDKYMDDLLIELINYVINQGAYFGEEWSKSLWLARWATQL